MITQIERANVFKNLHIKGSPLILFNIWDAGSAQTIQETGAKAIATGSWSVATAHGYEDGEKLPIDLALANLQRIVDKVNIPVTFDVEGGYGKSPDELKKVMRKVIEIGAVGVNFEDQVIGGKELYSVEDQCARIKTIRNETERLSIPIFINARTDLFLKTDSNNHNDHLLDEALERALAYAEAGANGFFAPGLKNIKHIEKLCKLLHIPLNIMVMSDTPPLKQLADAGVARISYGPNPYCQLMQVLKESGNKALNAI